MKEFEDHQRRVKQEPLGDNDINQVIRNQVIYSSIIYENIVIMIIIIVI